MIKPGIFRMSIDLIHRIKLDPITTYRINLSKPGSDALQVSDLNLEKAATRYISAWHALVIPDRLLDYMSNLSRSN